ncbi:unnamed protein product [Durusdinium trenchii]|uniref:Ubiquitin-like domain-containing protein n=1 Tax=Durusdinium trenchii TaxID=1381693 RepID=A0ABP0NZU5_9DINO
MAGEIKVRLQHHKDRFEVTLPATSRVSALKQEASRLTSVEPGRQRLICRGKAMGVFPIYDLLQMHNTLSWLEVLDGSLELQTLLPKAGAELTVMLMPMESSGDQARRTWQHYQRVLLAWLRSIWAFMYSFFHSLLVPSAYAPSKAHKEHHTDGIDPTDLARLAACGAGG